MRERKCGEVAESKMYISKSEDAGSSPGGATFEKIKQKSFARGTQSFNKSF